MPETGRSQATNLKTQKQTKWIETHQSQATMCFLRGPLDDWRNRKTRNSFEVCKTLTRYWVFKTNLSIFRVISFYGSWKFSLWFVNSAWDFWGINFGPVIFFFGSPRDFLGVLIFAPHSIIPVTWNREYPLWVELSSKNKFKLHNLTKLKREIVFNSHSLSRLCVNISSFLSISLIQSFYLFYNLKLIRRKNKR